MRRLPLALSLLLLAGCAAMERHGQRIASLEHPDYTGPGWGSAADERRLHDLDECNAELKVHPPRAVSWQAVTDSLVACLYARGWREPGQ